MKPNQRLTAGFFQRDVLDVAPDLLGKILVRRYSNQTIKRFMITEVEAYRGEEDLACHASKGRTPRTEVMYWSGGHIYVYLIYGIHYMLNFVTEREGIPQAILIRGIDDIIGPGRVSKILEIDMSHNQTDLLFSDDLWVEDSVIKPEFKTSTRIGIDYAGEFWKNRPWRFIAQL
ncbi:MAG TPA: 3-methyladenine DNA glycosylase [Marinilabiliales bacterium]|nr:MAG: 3-methyladenine DNA glycosylase [Bacteroidetes bacterium GWA2_40_14]OFX56939.1 MAG: 3-methyladenine DNA glycosylase [Bacteroidetes bacterium GWC2_40_13]OFX71654.1 MAG: 3-methyladenine DNA glycosylase [Bacteroidetes bacterium GWD2_40_43]OFX90193.1 MAG: 3-methyladenine DNA glycosylase [Bacteroidetes bacterium GWE2_40_63]OFY18661.1 MAG: 3-methyladenine DNA glycosylase [Bacteroidetes bacterium GWF2_40_13]OFZ27656.1 MAG: 3-methyladenine DNA glycosylase [Bacteroidetes bacterium RIFOXYC2_FULL